VGFAKMQTDEPQEVRRVSNMLVGSVVIAGLLAGPMSAMADDTARTTAEDQTNKPSDMDVTTKIRQELMKRDLSTQAKNITVVTTNGLVTLKGVVANAIEKNMVGEVARGVSPNVKNEVTVKQ
jgi:hyperosmotically inducible periplasmic protein